MTTRATGADTRDHTLTITMRPAADGDGIEVEAGCGCAWPNPAGYFGMSWQGWADTARQAAELAAERWDLHRGEVARELASGSLL